MKIGNIIRILIIALLVMSARQNLTQKIREIEKENRRDSGRDRRPGADDPAQEGRALVPGVLRRPLTIPSSKGGNCDAIPERACLKAEGSRSV